MRQKVDILTPAGFPATDAVRRATSAIPVVFVVPDPIGAKFAESLAHPGGNMTGMSLAIEEQFSGKWLELLKDAVPQVCRIAYLWNPNNTSSASSWSAMQGLAPKLGLALQSVELRDAKGLGQALETILRGRAEAVIVNSDAIMLSIDAQIVGFALTNRLPLISPLRHFADMGGLISYGPSLHELWRHAATYVDKILKGAKPADLPVGQPTTFELIVNLKTAKALGLTIPQTLLPAPTRSSNSSRLQSKSLPFSRKPRQRGNVQAQGNSWQKPWHNRLTAWVDSCRSASDSRDRIADSEPAQPTPFGSMFRTTIGLVSVPPRKSL